MKHHLVALCIALLSGCASLAPVPAKFPEAPKILLTPCPPLKQADTATTSIVELLKVIVDNYITHYECSIRNSAWIDWYRSQQKIFEESQNK